MNKKLSKILSAVLVLILALTMAMPAMAATPDNLNATGAVEIDKKVKVDQYAVLPGVSFNFTLGVATPAIDGFTGHAGVGLDKIEVTGSNASYNKDSHVITLPYSNADLTAARTDDNNYITKGFVIDFTKIGFAEGGFNEPGVYRYTVKETGGTDTTGAFGYDTDTTYYIDVYVGYAEDSDQLSILSVIVTNSGSYTIDTTNSEQNDGYGSVEGKKDATPDGNSTSGFTPKNTSGAVITNTFNTHDLTVTKTVSGNQGDKSKKFTFTIEIEGLVAEATYTVQGYSGTVTADGTGKIVLTDVKLADGESVVFKDLPKGAKYKVTETDGTGYTVTGQVTTATAIGDTDANVTVNNEKDGTIPTGILLTIAPFAALMIIGLVGVIVILKKKKTVNK